eukprot:13598006-Alexandrium_andersonii.AAC.1
MPVETRSGPTPACVLVPFLRACLRALLKGIGWCFRLRLLLKACWGSLVALPPVTSRAVASWPPL